MSSFLDPGTSMALLQATEGDSKKSMAALKSAKQDAKLDEAAREFEAVFISEMMKPMFEGIETDGTFGGGKGEEVFRSFLIQEYGAIMAQTGAVGIAAQVKSAMVQMQAEAEAGGKSEMVAVADMLADIEPGAEAQSKENIGIPSDSNPEQQHFKTPHLLQGALNDD